ncbi:2Fe-2S iron-sulfur cluster-binding protein [Pseudomonas izuensis]|uniref:2Fe-2S iron-sulfur cluster binding domain-containing protein n=1 Tax=Pseudomonas izuensis TaxID=2684212 RepID=A0ABM7RQC9_9PSED|nr:2Fe-2S iron-sulfur cluster-binding protein [Pseudomonas izuensis]BCX67894.1 2Fe-2S iron-sulfur cluster binding domain-containing protein [Pseudomonas izuensis]
MPGISFIEHNGKAHQVEVEVGNTLMQAAQFSQVPGILGDCGGNCSCATCHCYIDAPWAEKIPQPSSDELLLIDGALDVQRQSRLACQVVVTMALDGLVVRLPPSQM